MKRLVKPEPRIKIGRKSYKVNKISLDSYIEFHKRVGVKVTGKDYYKLTGKEPVKKEVKAEAKVDKEKRLKEDKPHKKNA